MSVSTKSLISIILPSYNEENCIEKMVISLQSELKEVAFDYEIIIVDDGSTDNTYEESINLAKRYNTVKAIKLSRNFGKEAALLVGFKAAKGNAVVSMDADLQHPPAIIHELFAKWQEGYKVVHAVKEDRNVDNIFNRMGATFFNYLFKCLGGIDLRNSSDFILIDRDAVDVIAEHLKERNRFYRGLAHWIGYKQASVNFTVKNREDGSKSRFSFLSLVNLALDGIVSFTSFPLHIISILGVLSCLIGLIIGLDAFISWVYGSAVLGYATIIMTLLIIGGFIMTSLGIIGEYIAKIYEEVKERPSYIVESEFGFGDKDTKLKLVSAAKTD